MCTSLPSICLDADRRSPAHGITVQAWNNAYPSRLPHLASLEEMYKTSVDNLAQMAQPSIPQQPPDDAWSGKIFFRECEAAGAIAECPIPLPPRRTIESRAPMTSVFGMAEGPKIKDLEHYFFYITPTAPNRLFHKLLSHLKEREAAGVVHLHEFNITLYLVPASESSLTGLGETEDPTNALVCFLIVT